MPHENKPKCPNPYTVYRALKIKDITYAEWKARLMVKAGGKESRFKHLVAKSAVGLPNKTVKESHSKQIKAVMKDIRKDMRKRFKVDRDQARQAVREIVEALSHTGAIDDDDSTVMSNSSTASSVTRLDGSGKGYVPSAPIVFKALKEESKIDESLTYDKWKAKLVLKAGGPTKKRRYRQFLVELANTLNNNEGISIIRSKYVQSLKRVMRAIAKDLVACKNLTRSEAKQKVQDLMQTMYAHQDDDDSTIISIANGQSAPSGGGSPSSAASSAKSFRLDVVRAKRRPGLSITQTIDEDGDDGDNDRTIWQVVGGKAWDASRGVRRLTRIPFLQTPQTPLENEEETGPTLQERVDSASVAYIDALGPNGPETPQSTKYRRSSMYGDDEDIPPSFYRRNQW